MPSGSDVLFLMSAQSSETITKACGTSGKTSWASTTTPSSNDSAKSIDGLSCCRWHYIWVVLAPRCAPRRMRDTHFNAVRSGTFVIRNMMVIEWFSLTRTPRSEQEIWYELCDNQINDRDGQKDCFRKHSLANADPLPVRGTCKPAGPYIKFSAVFEPLRTRKSSSKWVTSILNIPIARWWPPRSQYADRFSINSLAAHVSVPY
jgi:hypothetical protein